MNIIFMHIALNLSKTNDDCERCVGVCMCVMYLFSLHVMLIQIYRHALETSPK